MGKNIHGGAGHKKFARKHTGGATKHNNKLRISEDPGEIYAIVTKMLGNNMFHCHGIDGIIRLGHIRGKFTGRGKRDNMVEGGKWILIGLREWDIPSEKSSSISKGKTKMQECDLLEVYSDMDKQRLKDTVSTNWIELDSNDVSKTTLGAGDNTFEDDIMFTTQRDTDRDRLIQEMRSSNLERITLKVGDTQDDAKVENENEIDFDEI